MAHWRHAVHGDDVWIDYKGFILILSEEELDELIALLQTVQQEKNPNCPHCQASLASHKEIARKQAETALKVAEGRQVSRKSG